MSTVHTSLRHIASGLRFWTFFLIVFAGIGHQDAQTSAPSKTTGEYENLPLSSKEFRLNMRKSELIARGRVIDYKTSQGVNEHTPNADRTTILVSETYVGSILPGSRVEYFCVCHHESLIKPDAIVGHEVIVFLDYNAPMHSWEPATANYQLFFHPALRQKILDSLKNKK